MFPNLWMIKEYLIKALEKQTEADVSVLLYNELIYNSIQFKAEVKLPKSIVGGRGCRFDVLVYKNNEPLCIIEIKRLEQGKAFVQSRYYTQVTGLPVFVCGGKTSVDKVVEEVIKLLGSNKE